MTQNTTLCLTIDKQDHWIPPTVAETGGGEEEVYQKHPRHPLYAVGMTAARAVRQGFGAPQRSQRGAASPLSRSLFHGRPAVLVTPRLAIIDLIPKSGPLFIEDQITSLDRVELGTIRPSGAGSLDLVVRLRVGDQTLFKVTTGYQCAMHIHSELRRPTFQSRGACGFVSIDPICEIRCGRS